MAQQGILSLSIKDRPALYSAYMSFVQGGGLFVQSTKRFKLGDEVFLLLTLMELEERLPIPGKEKITSVSSAPPSRMPNMWKYSPPTHTMMDNK